MGERIKTSSHDVIFATGLIAIIFIALIVTGHVKGLASWYNAERTWAFNMDGDDYAPPPKSLKGK